jgi:asparagine synthase (glutamine-hydrolysing)
MCGIAGIVDDRAQDLDKQVEVQLRTLDHRGPDSWGVFSGRGATIGQTRLAIIDLVTGDPPITNEDGTVGVALNGEIYNYEALRNELGAAGHRFKTQGDTEVIALLAQDLEPVALAQRLEGMFAFAVWDDPRRRLVIGRDRFGKKPLYYAHVGGRFVFGSEIKAVRADRSVPAQLEPTAIPSYLTFGYVPTPDTFFSDIKSLPPAHVLVLEDGRVTVTPYWSAPLPGVDGTDHLDVTFDEAAREVRRLLTASIERRLISDVPLGAFLSGGVDSSTVVGIMAALDHGAVKTFTIGFDDDEGFDERPYARTVAARFATDHTEFVVHPNAVELMDDLLWHYDEPFGDSSAIPTWFLSRLTRQHVTVALCGDGGDEVFAGYERFTAAMLLNRLGPVLHRGGPMVAAALARTRGGLRRRTASARRFLHRAGEGLPDAYMGWVSYFSREEREGLLGSSASRGADAFRGRWHDTAGADVLDRVLDLNLRTYLLDDLLPKVDRMAMAHALEVRSPFLDRELVEFALRLPPAMRARGLTRKRVLKAAVADLLPEEILDRPKRGFGVPLGRWFRGELAPYVEAMLQTADSRARSYLDPTAIDDYLLEHRVGAADHGLAIWTLLTLEAFLRREDW